jgi:hypothetical protein
MVERDVIGRLAIHLVLVKMVAHILCKVAPRQFLMMELVAFRVIHKQNSTDVIIKEEEGLNFLCFEILRVYLWSQQLA